MNRRLLLALIVVCTFISPLPALESFDIHTGLYFIGNPPYSPASVDDNPTGAPSPILNALTISFPIELGSYFRFAPELSLYGTQYGIISGYDKVVPVEREFANAIWFLGAMIDLSFWLDIPLSERIGLGISMGPSVLARAPLTAWGTGWSQLETIAAYLYGQGRFFYPHAGLFFTWRPEQFESIEVSLRGRAYFPVFHAWDNENVGFFDQFIVAGSIGIRIYPRKKDVGSEPGS